MDFIPLAEPRIGEQDIARVSEQLASTFVGPGAATEEYGRQIAGVCKRNHALPVCSGTVALSVAATAIGLKAGDEIILPCYGVLSVINAFKTIGLQPVLVDVDSGHGCIDPLALEKVIGPKTKAVCYVSFLGNIGKSLRDVQSLCRQHDLILIEDAAWSLGRSLGQHTAGCFGDISITSFSVPKIITTGQGGAVMTDSLETFQTLVRLTDQGGTEWRKTNRIERVGSNYRMSDVNAALGMSQLAALEQRLQLKQEMFDAVNEILGGRLARTEDNHYSTQHVIFVKDTLSAIERIRSAGVAAASPYCVYSKLPPYADLDTRTFPGGEFWERHAVFLPFGLGTGLEKMKIMAERVKALGLDFVEV